MSAAEWSLLFVGAFLAFTLLAGLTQRKVSSASPDDYFLAGRSLSPFVMFFTLIATNFSAFFFLGFAQEGYQTGFAFYPMIAFGTAFVGLTFFFVGDRVRLLAKEHGYITPPELFGGQADSRALQWVVLVVMTIFTIPYIAIQPIGAGILLATISGGAVTAEVGAGLLSVVIVLYVLSGGMRSVAITDVLQGFLMFVLIGLAFAVIAYALGGFEAANLAVFEVAPEMFAKEGADGRYTPQSWFSLMLLWFVAVPMFPQMFMRFYTARSSKALKIPALLYPLVTAIMFVFPIVIGVWGHIAFPELTPDAAKNILPQMLTEFTPPWMQAAVMVGALAAFMSTMDSQLLALSSMFTRDVAAKIGGQVDARKQVWLGKLFVVGLAAIGFLIAISTKQAIFALVELSFSGLAILFPATVMLVYRKNVHGPTLVASIIGGEAVLILFATGQLTRDMVGGFEPIVPALLVAIGIILPGTLQRVWDK